MSSSIHVLNTSLGGGLRPPSEPPPGIAPAKPALEAEHLSRGARIIRFVRRQPTLVVGVVVLAIIALGGAFAPVWWTGDPLEMRPIERLTSPVAGHWFGTDNFGRDVYTRTIYGTRVSLIVGATVSILGLLIGTTLGLVIGFYRRLDAVMMRVIRVVRASVLSLREHTMVEGARALGARTPRILMFYILPALAAPLIVQATYICASAILFEAYLSFLGAGTPPHIPSWGNIMAEGKTYVQLAFWIILFPGLFLALTVLAINLVGDGLRETLDVR